MAITYIKLSTYKIITYFPEPLSLSLFVARIAYGFLRRRRRGIQIKGKCFTCKIQFPAPFGSSGDSQLELFKYIYSCLSLFIRLRAASMAEVISEEAVVYLHGDLDLKIIEAKCLPNMDLVSERMRRLFVTFSTCHTQFNRKKQQQQQHHALHKIITSDPYVTVCLAGATVARTRVISNSQSPAWNESFNIPLAHPVSEVEFYVKDNDVFGADLIGVATVSAHRILSGETIREWLPILNSLGKPPKPDASLRLEMKFTKCEDSEIYRIGIATDPDHFGVRNSYFPVRKGGSVTLYQDAHVPESLLPEIELDGGKVFQHDTCWEDICHAILEAHHLVYIVGWSVFHKVKLVRERTRPLPCGGELSLGDLLKYKSQEGVRVLLLVWDDKTSHSKFFINTVFNYNYSFTTIGKEFLLYEKKINEFK